MTMFSLVHIHSVFSETFVTARFTDVIFYLLMYSLDVGFQVVGQRKTLFAVTAFMGSYLQVLGCKTNKTSILSVPYSL